MSCPSTPIEALARSVESAFAIKYPTYYEDDELSTALTTLTPNEGAGFHVQTISPEKTRDRLERSLQLHARTGQILSSYRAFLTDYQNDTFDDEEERERGRTIANDRVFSENSLDNRSIRKDADEVLQRCLFYDEPRSSSSDFSTLTNRDRAHVNAIASRSNRVRYGLVAVGCVLFIAIVLVGVAVNKEEAMKTPPPKSTPGWHEEMAFVLDHEDDGAGTSVQKKLRGQLFGNIETQSRVEPDPQPSSETSTIGDGTSVSEVEVPSFNSSPTVSSVDSSSFKADGRGSLPKTESPEDNEQVPEFEFKSTDGESANDSPAPPVPNIEEYASNLIYNAIEAAKYDSALKLHENFKPMWLGSYEGWNGGSHDDAVEFCRSIRGKQLCPYAAMCPYGPSHNVMAGHQGVDFAAEGEQWAPVFGHGNRWVQIGVFNDDTNTRCMSYEQLKGSPPSWGFSQAKQELKQHVMCCSIPSLD
mmetsp:Transcript_8066/g.18420  ORF Transcript_8066/g.18420 Transcript_8066/m.18420 type:complete len:473 (+) Transcript_8066:342-1760(+)